MKTKLIFYVLAIFSLSPWCSSGIALLVGAAFALAFGNPFLLETKKITPILLSTTIVGLGFGMNLNVIAKVGSHGIGYTVIGILMTFILGIFLGKILNMNKNTALLVTVGTAICGGSAIAAITSVIYPESEEVSVSLAIVFILNAIALMIFPFIGHQLHLTQIQFGLWSALSIHDTSSVVGAAAQYGKTALEVGTTLKLARALWIIPVTLVIGFLHNKKRKMSVKKIKFPWFIIGFITAAAAVTLFPNLSPLGHQVEGLARKLMLLTLFLIGANLTLSTIKLVGFKPFIQGIVLWIIMTIGTVTAISLNWIKLF